MPYWQAPKTTFLFCFSLFYTLFKCRFKLFDLFPLDEMLVLLERSSVNEMLVVKNGFMLASCDLWSK